METTKKRKYEFLDILFLVLWGITQYFTRNSMTQIMMLAFCGCVGVALFVKPFTKKRTAYFLWNIAFVLYGYIQIRRGDVIHTAVAMRMVRSLSLNLIMTYGIVQYITWKEDLRNFLKLVEWGTFIVAIAVVAMSLDTISEGRLGGGTEINGNMLAMLSVYSLILSMYLRKGDERPILYTFKMIFYVGIILLTGSRKGLLMILIAIMTINFINGKKKIIKNIFIGIITVAVLYFLVMKVPLFYNIIGVRFENLFEMIFEGSTSEGSLTDRQALIEIGWKKILAKPWTGYGYDCFQVISEIAGSGEYDLYSHNNYIEILFGGGIIALCLYYIPILSILVGLIKNMKKDPCVPYITAILVSKLSIEYAYVSYYERMDTYIIAILLGCLLWCKNRKIKDEGEIKNAVNQETFKESI